MTTTPVIAEAEEALLVLDHAGRVRSATDRAAALLGRPLPELAGRRWTDIAVPPDITVTPREHRLRTARGVSRLRLVALSLSS
ncbi:MAG: PAS domain-containing protein, partial [Verrucomicrobiota bacterium]